MGIEKPVNRWVRENQGVMFLMVPSKDRITCEQSPHAMYALCVFGLFISPLRLVFLFPLMVLCCVYAPLCAFMLHRKEQRIITRKEE
jgi:hypothetical protein